MKLFKTSHHMWGIETETLFEFEATDIVKEAEGGVR
jgi:hypothetical protein